MIMRRANVGSRNPALLTLQGRRVLLRPLAVGDFREWREVRRVNAEWLTKWEPQRPRNAPDPIEDRSAFVVRCMARDRDRQAGAGFAFGIFYEGAFVGEMNLNSVQRGPFQSANVGYWISERVAGLGLTPESLVAVLRFAFENLRLHRVEVAIIPRNTASHRVVEKLQIRNEGTALRFLEINGVWEDHVRYAMTGEEWQVRGAELSATWLGV